VLADALELWKQAQAGVEEAFGDDRLQSLLDELTTLGQAVRH
jgi:hypothetical protein